MANGGIALNDSVFTNSPAYGVVGGIPTIVITGVKRDVEPTLWQSLQAGIYRASSLFRPQVGTGVTVSPDVRGMTPQPGAGIVQSTAAPLLAIALAGAAAYFVWKAAK